MKKLLAGLILVSFVFVAVQVHAGEFSDLKKKIGDARSSLLIMVKNKNKRGPGNQELVKKTADAVSSALANMKAPDGKEAKFEELVDTWNAFKKTRENSLVSLILSDNQEEAERIAHGVQQERLDRMNYLCDELDK